MLDFKSQYSVLVLFLQVACFFFFPPFFSRFLSDVICASNAECGFSPINL